MRREKDIEGGRNHGDRLRIAESLSFESCEAMP